ncbi:hypothetical protein PanWU01x14_153900 [Parasponia andersonii]|uniref:Late embryogenesis abundant protein LEA-2 subgroup domain-containing protein n=1 Tax=Parasponia andersonii TaxID=3476 RepID=A0A2P5CHA0_PARAD|nr:hypothetical protein PanWU01x14_153900 [Parasponia andersonii]
MNNNSPHMEKTNNANIPPPPTPPRSLPSSHDRYSSLSSTTPAADNAAATALDIVIGYPAPESKSTHNPNHRKSSGRTCYCAVVTLVILMVFLPLYYMVVLNYPIEAPKLPSFSVSSAFANVSSGDHDHVRGVNLDLDLLRIYNTSLVFDGADLRPFEQAGKEKTTVRISLENITMPVDEYNYYGRAAGVSVLQFDLKAKLRFKGKTLSMQEIPIFVVCKDLKIPISYNATEKVGFKVRKCVVDGSWDSSRAFALVGNGIPVFLLVFVCCLFSSNNSNIN